MAKKTIEKFSDNAVINNILSKYESGVLQTAEQIIQKPKLIVPVSPALDIILGGGIPQGSVIRLTGKEGVGKTSLALIIARNTQILDDKAEVIYLNIEGRLKRRDLEGIPGLNLDKFKIIGSFYDEERGVGKILSAEEYLDIAEGYIKNQPHCIVIIDSVSQLVTSDELTSSVADAKRAPGAVLMSRFCKKISNAVSVNNVMLISITHKISNTGGMGLESVESGGNKIKYATDVGLEAKYTEKWSIGGENGQIIGHKIKWRTNKTALNVGPCQECTSYLRYGQGIDDTAELIELAESCGFISKAGAWYTLTYMQEHLSDIREDISEWNEETMKLVKAQGAEKLSTMIKENPKWKELLNQKIRDMLL